MKLDKWLFVLCLLACGGPLGHGQEPGAAVQDAAVEDKEAAKSVEAAKPVEEPPPAAVDAAALVDAQPEATDKFLERKYERAMTIDVRGPIFGSLKNYLLNRIEAARRAKIDLLIFRVTSPGGSLDDSIELSRAIGNIDWATTMAYIPEEAYSGAAILVLGCDRIYMNPRAVIGDAGPIVHDGEAFRFVEQKRVSAIAAVIGQLAEVKQRPAALGEAMVDRKLTIMEATDKVSGKKTYLTAEQVKLREYTDKYDVGPALPESGLDRYLTVSGTRAKELQLAEGIFNSENELVAGLKFDSLKSTKQTWVDSTVFILNRPFITGLLLLCGLIGLYIEITVPGISVAGLTSLLCFGIFFWSHALGGTSGWLEVMLFALGISAVVIEIFILPGTALFGLSGVVLIVLSLVMASQDFVVPQTTLQWTTLGNNLLMVLGTIAVVGTALAVQIMYFDWIPGLGRLRLQRPDDFATSAVPSLAGGVEYGPYQPPVGTAGVSESVLRPAGKVRFENHIVDVVTEGDFLDPGTPVEVIKREGNRTIVRRV